MGLRFLAIACLVGAAFAGPLQKQGASQCSTQCSKPLNPKFNYENGKAYTYEYRGENVITTAGKPKQKASIEGLAVISVVDQCEMVLQLKNLRVQQKLSPEEIRELIQKLETPLPFAYEDGKIEHICPSPEEELQSLNIKKGLISAFVNTMSKLDQPQQVKEMDSMGNCSTEYTVRYAQGWEIKKSKSLKSCSNRHSSVTALITNPYQTPDAKLNTLPIFPEESLMCTQMIEDKIVKKVECTEKAQIKPLRQRNSVIQFEGQVSLSLLSVAYADRMRTATPSKRESLLYSLEETKDVKSRQRETEQLLREMCLKNQPQMDVNVSRDFIQLVTLVKSLPYSSLASIHSAMKDGRICASKKVRDVFVDTLPMAGSDSAIKLMVQLIEKREISGLKAQFWPVTLALIPRPSKEAISEIIPLLKEKPSSVVLLGVSAMVHRFCKVENCETEPAVQEITSILKRQLGQSCSEENESQVLATLKAFGNMGYHGKAEKTILACAQNKDKPTRLRLAAIDAFRRIHKKRPEELVRIYTDSQETSEIRIAAFSTVMKQADLNQLRAIKSVAEQELDDQVSGYAASFIKNMNKTSSPLKKHVKQSLNQIEINPPKVKYWENSKNIEFSSFSETFNIGGSVETDIIHSKDSKIPRSLTTRLDADVLNTNINIFEAGVRAEGLEAIIKNLIGLKDRIPKRPSWNFMSSSNIFDGAEAEASAFIRIMNTEILDLSASDLSAVGEMIEIADLMSKLAQGKSSDFSHSFLFMNSQLIIPSVTGRSYSFGITGSATLGLTASSKLDVLRFPRNVDVGAHFQPSLNVELSTTVGIQSNKHRPDLKLSTRMHLESDVAAQFQIKEGHLAIANVSLPSENVILARVSSDITEIDADHQEKPLFEVMQKKVDYCFDKLQKPLGLSVCGMLEVPKPFLTRSFPFINGIGSIELSIKKSDEQMKSFEVLLEKPRHHTPVRKYRASFDTPGSRFSRRFLAELLVKEQGQDSKEYKLELSTPFKNAGGRGSYISNQELVEGAFELNGISSRLLLANVSASISNSQVKKVIKPSLKIVVGRREPMQFGGLISVTKGRKQLITFDMKTSSRKPMAVRGSITKEGKIMLSKKAEWKISSDMSFENMLLDARVRSTVEKQSKQAQTISASLETDYKKGSQKYSMKLSGTSQKSSSKLSSAARFQSSQFPSANWNLKWDRQEKSGQNLINNVTLKYGLNPESTYIILRQNSQLNKVGLSHCNVSLIVPQYNIDSDLTVKHEIQTKESPKIFVEADLRYKEEKHAKGLLSFDLPSKSPLKAITRAEIEYPTGKISYSDEVEETSTNKFEGKSILQYKEKKQVELDYVYQILSGSSLHHHELTTSIKLPTRQSPIQTSTTVKFNKDSLDLEGALSFRHQPLYSVLASLNKKGSSQMQLQSPKIDAHLKLHNEAQIKAIELDLKVKTRTPRRIVATTRLQLEQEKSLLAEISLDADRQPEQKLSILSSIDIRSKKYSVSSRIQVLDLLTLAISESGEKSLLGSREGSIKVSSKYCRPISVQYGHDLAKENIKSYVKISQNNVEKLEAKIEGKTIKSIYGRELRANASLISLDRSFESKKLGLVYKRLKSGSKTDVKTALFVQKSRSQVYNAEINTQYHSNGISANAQISTPHKVYSNPSCVMSIQKSGNSLSSSISVVLQKNKVISLASSLEKRSSELSATVDFRSPFDIVRNVKAHLTVDNHRSKKSVLSYLDVNSARIGDVEASMTKSSSDMSLQGQLKVSPLPNIPFQGLSMSFKKSRYLMNVTSEVLMQGDKKIILTSEMTKGRSGILISSEVSTPYSTLKRISASYKQSRSLTEISASCQYLGNKEISLNSTISQERSKISATTILRTPYKVQNAKAHISIENLESQKKLLAFVDANSERKGDIEISYLTSSEGIELQSRLKTAHSEELSTYTKVGKSSKSFIFTTKVVKGASRLLSSSSRHQSEKLENVLLDVAVSRNVSRDTQNYSMRLSGPIPTVSVNVSTSRNESNILNIEASACQERQQSQCYRLKTTHKALKNSEGYRQYQKLSIDCEKSVGESSEKLGTAHVIYTTSEYDYKSKVVVEFQGKNVGYEARVHKRAHEHDHCSFDSHIFLPSKTSRVRASILHAQESLMLEIEAIPDSSIPSKKLGLEMKKEWNQQQQELSGYIQLSHPKMEKPIILTCRVQKEGWIPVQGKWELQYSSLEGSRFGFKTLTLELETDLQQRSMKKQFVSYKLYSQDKSIDASFELMKEISGQQSVYGYELSWKSQSQTKKMGVSIQLSQQESSRPRNILISYYTPSTEMKIQGSQSDVLVTMLSSGQKVKEVVIKTQENCIEVNVQRPEPYFISSICVNKRVRDAVQFISLEAECHHHKCLEVSIGIEPENPAFMDITMRWEKEDLKEALVEITGLKHLRAELKELKEQLMEYIQKLKEEKVMPVLRKLIQELKEKKEQIVEKFLNYFRRHHQMLKTQLRQLETLRKKITNLINEWIPLNYIKESVIVPLVQAYKCLMDTYFQLVLKHLPDVIHLVVDATREQFLHCLKKFCVQGTFCHDLIRVYERRGMKEAKKLLYRKVEQQRISLQKKAIALYYELDLWNRLFRFVKTTVETVREVLDQYLGKFMEGQVFASLVNWVKWLERSLRTKAIDLMDRIIEKINEIFDRADRDEDYQVIKPIFTFIGRQLRSVWECREIVLSKLRSVWENREQIMRRTNQTLQRMYENRERLVEKEWEPFKKNMLSKSKSMLEDRIQVNEFDLQNGKVMIRFRHPLGRRHIQVVSNAITAVSQKLQESVAL